MSCCPYPNHLQCLVHHLNVISYHQPPKGTRPDKGAKAWWSQQIWDRSVECEPWVMDDGKAPGLTGNNSLPRGLGPFTGHKETGTERDSRASLRPSSIPSPQPSLTNWGFHWLPSYHRKETTINMKYEIPQSNDSLRCRNKLLICLQWEAKINCCLSSTT